MLRCSVSDVGLPSVVGIPAGQTVHEMIAGRLGDDRGSRDRVASCVAIHEGVMDVADFRKWEAVDHDAIAVAPSDFRPAEESRMARRMAMAVATRMLTDRSCEPRPPRRRRRGPAADPERPGAHGPRQEGSCCRGDPRTRGTPAERRRPRPPPVLPVGRGPLHRHRRGGAPRPRPPVLGRAWGEGASAQLSRFSRIRAALPLSARR